jgi:hypothetical protein
LEEIGALVQKKADISREEELKKSPMEAEETPEERKERIENLVKEHVRNNN